jgi:hypothetical protein
MGKANVVQTPNSYRIPLPKSVVDPDLLNLDPDLDPAFQVNTDPCDGFFWRLMSSLAILWRVIPSSPLWT